MNRLPPSHVALAGLLIGAAVTHYVAPKPYDEIVPKSLPGSPRFWTYASGAAELAVGVAVAHPKTRRRGGLLAAGLFVAVFPANVKMAKDRSGRPAPVKAVAYGRLPFQAPLVWWALKVSREARRRD